MASGPSAGASHDPEHSLTDYIHHLEKVQQRLMGARKGECQKSCRKFLERKIQFKTQKSVIFKKKKGVKMEFNVVSQFNDTGNVFPLV